METAPPVGAAVSIWLMLPLGAAIVAAWVAAHRWLPKADLPGGPWGQFACRALISSLAWWWAIQLAGRALMLGAGRMEWIIALAGGLCTEAVFALYADQRRTIEGRTGRCLPALRLGVLVLVLGLLLQPALVYQWETRIERSVAVLLDDSASMQLDDPPETTRQALARHVLLDKSDQSSLLAQLTDNYAVTLYRFASTPKLTDIEQWQSASEKEGETNRASDSASQEADDLWPQATDLTAALKEVQKEVPANRLAGVLVLTDGRHNHGAAVEAAAREFGQQHVPICSVVLGSTSPRRGAAITDVQCPETVLLGDKVAMNVRVKATGLRGQSLKITMTDGSGTVDEKKIDIVEDDSSKDIVLTCLPKKVGLHHYQIILEGPPGDTLQSNKRAERYVAVSDGRIKLLLADNRPRWEFRYLRNLFAGRDKTVFLQYVLLSPDKITGAPPVARVAASVARPYGEFEATELPATPDEWLKFDLIVLGDLPPEALDDTVLAALQKFVSHRGGTLVVIAGPNHMPQAFAGAALAELLPATFAPGEQALLPGPEPAYRLSLTREGGTHTIMRQRSDPRDNAAVWNSLPTMDWRHPVVQVKPAATVLAYAEPADSEEPAAAPDRAAAPGRSTNAQRLRLAKQNPLILVQRYGAGNVLLLTFDRTWRLRYRVGDTYHHQFWSQVLRWATADRLAAGTAHVRLGTDRLRYQAGEPVGVRAQLLEKDGSPVANEKVTARVLHGDRLVLRKTLDFVPDSQGCYQGDLGALPKAGAYRVELEGPAVARLLAIDEATTAAAEFLVTSLDRSIELVQTSADWKLPTQIADLSGGKAVGPADAREVIDVFQRKPAKVKEVQYVPLWDSWIPLVLILVAASGEWILRKKGGLA